MKLNRRLMGGSSVEGEGLPPVGTPIILRHRGEALFRGIVTQPGRAEETLGESADAVVVDAPTLTIAVPRHEADGD